MKSLNETEMFSDPIPQFEAWLNDALKAAVKEPTAMTLATSTFDGRPSARIVLLKSVSKAGFSFFTNYESRKAKEIMQNPNAYLVLFWSELERQIRIEGKVHKLSEKESDEYFSHRPKKTQITSWASPQSRVISSRKYLENLINDFEEEFKNKQVTRPKNWGGFILEPYTVEFWQGRENRVHDRIQYTRENEKWIIERLAP